MWSSLASNLASGSNFVWSCFKKTLSRQTMLWLGDQGILCFIFRPATLKNQEISFYKLLCTWVQSNFKTYFLTVHLKMSKFYNLSSSVCHSGCQWPPWLVFGFCFETYFHWIKNLLTLLLTLWFLWGLEENSFTWKPTLCNTYQRR